jgi:hypothetical protein
MIGKPKWGKFKAHTSGDYMLNIRRSPPSTELIPIVREQTSLDCELPELGETLGISYDPVDEAPLDV